MGKISFDEQVEKVNGRAKELMQMLYDMNNGLDVDFDEVICKLLSIHRDELRMLRTIKKYETELDKNKPYMLDFSGFKLCNERRA